MPFIQNIITPFGFDLFCLRHKFLTYNLVGRNLKLRYRQSALGMLWSLILPLANVLIYYVVFQLIMKVSVPNYLAFIVTGVLPWVFFSQALTEGMESLVSNMGLITKVPLPLQVFPLVGATGGFTTFLISLPIILGTTILSGISPGPSIILLPLLVLMLFLLSYGFSLILSVAYVYFHDLKHIITVILQIWFYLTPIIYHPSMIPANLRWILYANPVASIITCLRAVLFSATWPEPLFLTSSVIWTLVILAAGIWTQVRYAKRIAEII